MRPSVSRGEQKNLNRTFKPLGNKAECPKITESETDGRRRPLPTWTSLSWVAVCKGWAGAPPSGHPHTAWSGPEAGPGLSSAHPREREDSGLWPQQLS